MATGLANILYIIKKPIDFPLPICYNGLVPKGERKSPKRKGTPRKYILETP
jgi:hypothetical protein